MTATPGGPTVIQLTSFSIEYDTAPQSIPPISDIEEVTDVTRSFLRSYFQANVPGLISLGLNYVGEALAFPTYTIDYEAVASVSDGTTKEDLDLILDSAFQGASLQAYFDLIAALPPENSFSNVQGIRKVATPENRSGEMVLGSAETSRNKMPIPLLAGAGAASFMLIVLGIYLNRREQHEMSEGKKLMDAADVTLAGDTFAGETYTDTVCSADKSRISRSSGSSRQNRTECEHFSEGYASAGGAPDAQARFEECKEEIEDITEASEMYHSQYGDVHPIDDDIYAQAFASTSENPLTETESAIDHTFITGREAYLRETRSRDVESGSVRSGIDSLDSRYANSTGSDTSIHIIEPSASDDNFEGQNHSYMEGGNESMPPSKPGDLSSITSRTSESEALYESQAVPSLQSIASKMRSGSLPGARRFYAEHISQVEEQERHEDQDDHAVSKRIERQQQPDPPQELQEDASTTTTNPENEVTPPTNNVARLIQRFQH